MLESIDTFSSFGKVREDFLEEVVFLDRGDSSAKVQKQERTSNYGNKQFGMMGVKSKVKGGGRTQNSREI